MDYHCDICDVYAYPSTFPFHCSKCGICRCGPQSLFFHCDTCGACYGIELQEEHAHVENALQRPCPICLEDLFTSWTEIMVLKCGHTIHQECMRNLMAQADFRGRCPTCNVTVYHMDVSWRLLAEQQESEQLPDEYDDDGTLVWPVLVNISCIDCGLESNATNYLSGHRCAHCNSYNTRKV